jgi:predicted metal-dependent phosphotriesterase family hydrolase
LAPTTRLRRPNPLESLRAAGFSMAAIETIAETNPRRIFPRLKPK